MRMRLESFPVNWGDSRLFDDFMGDMWITREPYNVWIGAIT